MRRRKCSSLFLIKICSKIYDVTNVKAYTYFFSFVFMSSGTPLFRITITYLIKIIYMILDKRKRHISGVTFVTATFLLLLIFVVIIYFSIAAINGMFLVYLYAILAASSIFFGLPSLSHLIEKA